MLLGIISDTHDKVGRTNRAVQMLIDAGAEALVHCGDITVPEIVYACGDLPGHYVFGNNDYDLAELRAAMKAVDATCLDWAGLITLGSKRLAVLHGHRYADYRQLLSQKPDYMFLGHSHIQQDEREGATRIINPGALHRASDYSVALLDLKTDELRFLPVE